MSSSHRSSRVNHSPDLTDRLVDHSDDGLDGYDVEQLINKAGGFGRMQWLLVLNIVLCYHGVNYFVYNLAYLELVPELMCKYAATPDEFVKCHDEKDVCNKDLVFDFYPNFDGEESFHNWMTEQNLYCEDSFYIGLFGSVYFIGFAINGLYLKQSDSFGRRMILLTGCIFQTILCYAIYFSQNFYAYYVLLFLAGISVAKNVCVYIYSTECVPAKYQMYVGAFCLANDVFIPLMVSSSYFYFGGKHWKYPALITLVFPVLGTFSALLIPESPRYLYARKKWRELRKTIRIYASVNGVDMDHNYQIDEEVKHKLMKSNLDEKEALEELEETAPLVEDEQEEFSVLKEIKKPATLRNFIVVLICFCVVSFNYYMISFYLKYVGGNIFINTASSTVSECIGNFVAGGVQKFIGTKKSFVTCFALSVVFALPLLFVDQSYLIAICVFSSKFFVEAAFCLAYYVNPEIFHPLFVPFSFSVCGFFARVVTIAAPEVAEVKPNQIPIIIFLALAGISTMAALFLRKPKERKESMQKTKSLD